MGHIEHTAIIVTVVLEKDKVRSRVEQFRKELPDTVDTGSVSRPYWSQLLIGPVESIVNGYDHYVLLPSGSKKGWETYKQERKVREKFINLFNDLQAEAVKVTYGWDALRNEVVPL